MTLKQLYLLSILVFSSSISYGQEKSFIKSLIVNTNGDSLKVFIKYQRPQKMRDSIQYKEFIDGEVSVLKPSDINYFIVMNKDEKYISIEIEESKKVFALLLSKGTIDLIKVNNTYYLRDKLNGINKLYNIDEDRSYRLDEYSNYSPYRKYGILNLYLSDCIRIKKDLNSIKLNEDNLKSLLYDYEKCVNPSGVEDYKIYSEKEFSKWTYKVNTELKYSRLSLKSEIGKTGSISPVLGVLIEKSFQQYKNPMAIESGLNFTYDKFLFQNIEVVGYITTQSRYTYKQFSIEIPITFKKYYNYTNYSPYFGLGAMYKFAFWSDNEIINQTYDNYNSSSTTTDVRYNNESLLDRNILFLDFQIGSLINLNIIPELYVHFSYKTNISNRSDFLYDMINLSLQIKI